MTFIEEKRKKMLQEPLFTWIFCVIPFLLGFINKYWIMRGKWEDENIYPRWNAFVSYYIAGSILFWSIISFGRLEGCTFS